MGLKIGGALLLALQIATFAWLSMLQLFVNDESKSKSSTANQVADLRTELDEIKSTQPALSTELTAATEQLAQVQQRITTIEQQIHDLGGSLADATELRISFAARLETISEELKRISRQVAVPSRVPASPPPKQQASPTRSQQVAQAPVKAPLPPAPFVLLGIETRAGEQFASVANRNASTIGDLQLLRKGEAFGDWTLLRLDDHSAVFLSAGEERVVSLR